MAAGEETRRIRFELCMNIIIVLTKHESRTPGKRKTFSSNTFAHKPPMYCRHALKCYSMQPLDPQSTTRCEEDHLQQYCKIYLILNLFFKSQRVCRRAATFFLCCLVYLLFLCRDSPTSAWTKSLPVEPTSRAFRSSTLRTRLFSSLCSAGSA